MMNFVEATIDCQMPDLATVLGLETTRPIKSYRLANTTAILNTGDEPTLGRLINDGLREWVSVTREQAAFLLRQSEARFMYRTERIH